MTTLQSALSISRQVGAVFILSLALAVGGLQAAPKGPPRPAKPGPKPAAVKPAPSATMYATYFSKGAVALRDAEQAAALAPNLYTSYLAAYELAKALGETAKAQQALQKAAAVSSIDAQFWLNVGTLYTQAYLKDDG